MWWTIVKWTKIQLSEENLACQIWICGLHIKRINFAFLSSVAFGHYSYFPGWVGGGSGKIKIKDHLSPAEAETRAELRNYVPKRS